MAFVDGKMACKVGSNDDGNSGEYYVDVDMMMIKMVILIIMVMMVWTITI